MYGEEIPFSESGAKEFIEKMWQQAFDDQDYDKAERLLEELELLERRSGKSTWAQYMSIENQLNPGTILQEFRNRFRNFGFWPKSWQYYSKILGSSPSMIAKQGEMDCVGRTFVAYAFLKRLEIKISYLSIWRLIQDFS